MERVFRGDRTSVRGDEKVLETGVADGCTATSTCSCSVLVSVGFAAVESTNHRSKRVRKKKIPEISQKQKLNFPRAEHCAEWARVQWCRHILLSPACKSWLRNFTSTPFHVRDWCTHRSRDWGQGALEPSPRDAEGQLYFNATELTLHYLTFLRVKMVSFASGIFYQKNPKQQKKPTINKRIVVSINLS